ncbi:hypothetical protein RZN22_05455 [Bacillaceae bacterium S4-13-58]
MKKATAMLMTILVVALIPIFLIQFYPVSNVTGEKVQDDTDQVVNWAKEEGLFSDTLDIDEKVVEKNFAQMMVTYYKLASSSNVDPYSVLASYEVPLVGYNSLVPSFQREEIPIGLVAQSISYLLGQGSSLSDANHFFEQSSLYYDFTKKATLKDVLSIFYHLENQGKNQIAAQEKNNPFGSAYQEILAFSKVDPISFGISLSSFSNYNADEADTLKDTDLTEEQAIELMSRFAEIYMDYEVDDYYRITTYDSKSNFQQAFVETSAPSITSRYLDYLAEEKEGHLYVIPREFPPLYMDGFDTHLFKLDNQHFVAIQTVYDEMVGSYQIIHEFECENGKWLISNLYGQPNPLLKTEKNLY